MSILNPWWYGTDISELAKATKSRDLGVWILNKGTTDSRESVAEIVEREHLDIAKFWISENLPIRVVI
jgi:hypothetical protein